MHGVFLQGILTQTLSNKNWRQERDEWGFLLMTANLAVDLESRPQLSGMPVPWLAGAGS